MLVPAQIAPELAYEGGGVTRARRAPPRGVPEGHSGGQFSTGFIRFLGMAESRVGNSENPNGLRTILEPFYENDSKMIKIHEVL